MKSSTDGPKEASLARKRALIRSLIQQTDWAQASAAVSPTDLAQVLEYVPPEDSPMGAQAPEPKVPLAEIIPFPKSRAG